MSKTASDVVFEFEYKNLGGNPWGSKYGFSFQFQQVYIDKDGKKGSGRTDTVGANLLVDSANAWEAAITVGPSWDSEAQANWLLVGTTTHEWEIDIYSEPARLSETYGYSWPSTYDRLNAIEITFLAGYGATAATVPETIKQAILLLLAHYYENREATTDGRAITSVPMAYESLIWTERAW